MADKYSLAQTDVTAVMTTQTATTEAINYGSVPTSGTVVLFEMTSNVLSTGNNLPTKVQDASGAIWTNLYSGMGYNALQGASALGGNYLSVWYHIVAASDNWGGVKTVTLTFPGTPTSWSGLLVIRNLTGFTSTAILDQQASGGTNTASSTPVSVVVPQFTHDPSGNHLIVAGFTRSASTSTGFQFQDIPAGATGAGTPGTVTSSPHFIHQSGAGSFYDAYCDGLNTSGSPFNLAQFNVGGSTKQGLYVLAFADGGPISLGGARSSVLLTGRPGKLSLSLTSQSRAAVLLTGRPVRQELTRRNLTAIYGVGTYGNAWYGYATTGLIEATGQRTSVLLSPRGGTYSLSSNPVIGGANVAVAALGPATNVAPSMGVANVTVAAFGPAPAVLVGAGLANVIVAATIPGSTAHPGTGSVAVAAYGPSSAIIITGVGVGNVAVAAFSGSQVTPVTGTGNVVVTAYGPVAENIGMPAPANVAITAYNPTTSATHVYVVGRQSMERVVEPAIGEDNLLV